MVGCLVTELVQRMASCDLERLYGETLNTLVRPAHAAQKVITFSASVLPAPAETMRTDLLICRKTHHHYGDAARVDLVQLYAGHRTCQLLGLWILSMVFHEQPVRSALSLGHEASTIKTVICDFKHGGTFWGEDINGYDLAPVRYRHFLSRPRRHPWTYDNVPVRDLPDVLLTNESELLLTEEDYQQRDTLIGFGNDRGAVRFGALLLDVGAAEDEPKEVDLEGELGFRGVAPGSPEIHIVTPGTGRWVAIGPDYPDFG